MVWEAKWTADIHVRAPPCPLHSPNPNTLWFKSHIVPNWCLSGTKLDHINLVLTWWQITWGFSCFPFPFPSKTGFSEILSVHSVRTKMLISHVGEWWHVSQAKDFWHMVHIWGISSEHHDHTACSCAEAWRLFMELSRQIPCIMLYRWYMPLDGFVLTVLHTAYLWKAAVQSFFYVTTTGDTCYH